MPDKTNNILSWPYYVVDMSIPYLHKVRRGVCEPGATAVCHSPFCRTTGDDNCFFEICILQRPSVTEVPYAVWSWSFRELFFHSSYKKRLNLVAKFVCLFVSLLFRKTTITCVSHNSVVNTNISLIQLPSSIWFLE